MTPRTIPKAPQGGTPSWRSGTGIRGRMTADLEAMPSAPPERIEEPPIVLLRYRGDELQTLFEAISTSTDHLSPWLAWASVEPLEKGLGDFIAHSIDAFDRGKNFDYAIFGTSLKPRW